MWYEKKGKDSDVAISTRVRIARNLSGYPFNGKLSEKQEKEIVSAVKKAYKGKGWKQTEMSSLPASKKAGLADRHIISREFAEKGGNALLIQNADQDVNIMVLEEDHVRIQSIVPGFDVRGAMEKAYAAEELLDAEADIAYSEKYGYLTHCPTNLGTGIRVSVMLHLPSYTETGEIRALALQLAKLGLTIRGADGEGSGADADLYQISNQVTLGVTEDEIAQRIENVISQIITGERALHEKASETVKGALRERARRYYGTLMYCESISSSELMSIYSDLRLAAASGLIRIPVEKLDEMLLRSMPGNIESECEGADTPEKRDLSRANLIREILSGSAI